MSATPARPRPWQPPTRRSNDVLRAEDVSLGPKGEATMFEVGEKEGVILPTSCWEALENACLMHRPDVVMVDPLVAINAVPENDNQLIRRVMTVLKIGLTQRFNCALVIAHHDLKAGGSNEDSDQTNARGAGDIVNAVRFEFAVKKMSVQQAGAMNVQEDRRGFYFRLGSPGSKVNYDEPLGSAWFERKAVPIAGESTVYCVPWEPPVGTLDEAQTAELIECSRSSSRQARWPWPSPCP